MKCVPVHHGIPAFLHRDEPWLHRHSENGALTKKNALLSFSVSVFFCGEGVGGLNSINNTKHSSYLISTYNTIRQEITRKQTLITSNQLENSLISIYELTKFPYTLPPIYLSLSNSR